MFPPPRPRASACLFRARPRLPALPAMGRRDKTSANIAPDAKRVARNKSEHTPLTDAQPPSRLPHFALAVVLAAALFAYRRLGASPQPLASVPASYALCADSQKIYTVNPALPVVDCFLVHRDTITATGTLGGLPARVAFLLSELTSDRCI